MKIQLAKTTTIWGLRDSDIFLTFADPGPVEVDEKHLDELQKKALNSAILTKKIVRLDPVESPKVEKKESEQQQKVAKKARKGSSKAKKLIQQKMAAIKVEINGYGMEDVPTLRRAMALEEKKNKPRKRVVNMLREKIAEIVQKEGSQADKILARDEHTFDIQEEETDIVLEMKPTDEGLEVKKKE